MESNTRTREMLCVVPTIESSVDSSDIEQVSDDDLGSFSLLESTNSSVSPCCLNDKGSDADEGRSDLSCWPTASCIDELPIDLGSSRVHSYTHTPNRKLNLILNFLMAVSIAMSVGLGIGHFFGYSGQVPTEREQAMLKLAQLRTLKRELADIPGCSDSSTDDMGQTPVFMEKLEQWKGIFLKIFAENGILQRALDQANIEIENYSQDGHHDETDIALLEEYKKLRLQLILQQLDNLATIRKMELLKDAELDKLQHSYNPNVKEKTNVENADKCNCKVVENDCTIAKEEEVHLTSDNPELKIANVELGSISADKTGVNVTTDVPTETNEAKQELNDLKLENSEFHQVVSRIETSISPELDFSSNRTNEIISANEGPVGFARDMQDINHVMMETQKIIDKESSLHRDHLELNLGRFYALSNVLLADIQNGLPDEFFNETLLSTEKFMRYVVKNVLISIDTLVKNGDESMTENEHILKQIKKYLGSIDVDQLPSKLQNIKKVEGNGATAEETINNKEKVNNKKKPRLRKIKKQDNSRHKIKENNASKFKINTERNENCSAWLFKRAQSRDKKRKEHQRTHLKKSEQNQNGKKYGKDKFKKHGSPYQKEETNKQSEKKFHKSKNSGKKWDSFSEFYDDNGAKYDWLQLQMNRHHQSYYSY